MDKLESAINTYATVEHGLRLEILGGARLSGSGFSHDRLERKTAALLAYVALEKDATRSRVAGLLWPDVSHATARNNLAQVAARLKKLAGRAVVVGKDILSLERVAVDVVELELCVQRADVGIARSLATELLLAGFDFPDCVELGEWLDWRRDLSRRTLMRALDLESRRLEAERDFSGAIDRTEEALRLDRWGEVTYRRLMRLHTARGDRARALDVFAECERVLREELGTEPSDDTRALAESLRHQSSSPASPPEEERAPSLRYDHPRFVGRGEEWAVAERAYEAGRTVFVSGEPGIGKTRFLLELADAKGRYLVLEGRPGDTTVPFASLARSLRTMLKAGSPTLPGWARLELSRILPELQVESAPARTEADRLRLFEAALELFRHACGETQTFVLDDLQFCDAASVEAFDHVLGRLHREVQPSPRVLIGFRRGELVSDVSSWVNRSLESGRATSIELEGLAPEAIWELATSLSNDARDRAPDLARASLGNPLFISEIMRSSGGTRGVPPRIERLLERRLERLSPGALRLARVAAILGNELSVTAAARVMDVPPLDLDESWAELEREQVLVERRFVHDLLAETLERSLSRALCSYLHGRVAEELARQTVSPAIVARHFLQGENEIAAAPFLMRSAEELRTLSRLDEAANAFERAGDIYLEHGEVRSAIGAWFAVGRFLRGVDRGARFERIVQRMALHARNDAERARALVVRAFYDECRDDLDSAVRHAAEALELATTLRHMIPRAEALRILFIVRMRQGRLVDAEVALGDFMEMCRASGQPEAEVAALWHGADLLVASDQHVKAIELYEKAGEIVERTGQLGYVKVVMRGLVAHSLLALGRTDEAASLLRQEGAPPEFSPLFRLRIGLCLAHLDMASGRFRTADDALTTLLQLVPDWLWESRLRTFRGSLLVWLGAITLGRNELLIVIDDERTDVHTRVDAMLSLARSSHSGLSDEQRAYIEHAGSPLQRLRLLSLATPDASEADLEKALAEAKTLEARGHEIALSVSLAEVLVRSGQHERALGLAENAWQNAKRARPVFPDLESVALARGNVREAARVDAQAAWTDALLVVDAAEIPRAWEPSYRAKNPVVARIVERARRAMG